MFDEFLKNCKPQDEIKLSKKRVKKNVAAVRMLVEGEDNSMKHILKHKALVIVIASVAALSLITGAAVVIHENGFYFDKGRQPGIDFYVMIAEDTEGAPKTLERICYDYNLPEKYKLYQHFISEDKESVSDYYSIDDKRSSLTILQSVKDYYTNPVVVGEDVWKPAEIRGCKGFTIVHTLDIFDGGKYISNSVIWDYGGYIHTVVGRNISMEEVMAIVNGMTEKQDTLE